jgi:hypothetical protein
MEEIYKVLRAGSAERTFRGLVETGLLAAIAPEVPGRITASFWGSLAALDAYRRRFKALPDGLSNAVLLGTLLIPLGLLETQHGRTKELGARFGILPLARRDVEELRQILFLQRHLRDLQAPFRVKRSIARRHAFAAAVTWLEVHHTAPELVQMWRALQSELHAADPPADASAALASPAGPTGPGGPPRRRRRRRRRRRFQTPG